MTGQNYPSELDQIESWSQIQQVSSAEGRVRFMGFVILNCIASSKTTREE